MRRFTFVGWILFCAAFCSPSGAALPPEGTYTFFDKPGYRSLAGHGKMTITRSGSFTGGIASLTRRSYGLDSRPLSFVFRGEFKSDGTADMVLANSRNDGIITLRLQYHGSEDTIDGQLVVRYVFDLRPVIHWFSAELAAPAESLEGRYTAALSLSKLLPPFPPAAYSKGHGWMLITVRADGRVFVVGRLGSGRPFSMSSRLREDGGFHFYTGAHIGVLPIEIDGSSNSRYSFHEDVYGLITLHEEGDADGDGAVTWEEFLHERFATYIVVFAVPVHVQVSRFAALQPGQLAFDFPNAPNQFGKVDVLLKHGGVVTTRSQFTLLLQDGLNGVGDLRSPVQELTFTFSHDQASGLAGSFKGALQFPDENVRRGFSGVILQKQNIAKGFFKGPEGDRRFTGSIRMAPAEEN